MKKAGERAFICSTCRELLETALSRSQEARRVSTSCEQASSSSARRSSRSSNRIQRSRASPLVPSRQTEKRNMSQPARASSSLCFDYYSPLSRRTRLILYLILLIPPTLLSNRSGRLSLCVALRSRLIKLGYVHMRVFVPEYSSLVGACVSPKNENHEIRERRSNFPRYRVIPKSGYRDNFFRNVRSTHAQLSRKVVTTKSVPTQCAEKSPSNNNNNDNNLSVHVTLRDIGTATFRDDCALPNISAMLYFGRNMPVSLFGF